MLQTHKHFSKPILIIIAMLLISGCSIFQPQAKPDYTVTAADMDFVFVKGGTFKMGTSRATEKPIHDVTISDLFVGMHEVTFEQFDLYCTATPKCKPPTDESWGRGDRPVINVTWDDANTYATWLSKQTGLQFRLPTESEWEYFARAGTTTSYWTGDSLPKDTANCRGCGSKWDNKMTAPVGSFPPNPWGIHDTAGNIIEWVQDDYKNDYAGAPADGSAVILNESSRKVQRGGAWNYRTRALESSARDYRSINTVKSDTGFRLVLIPSTAILPPAK